MEQRSIHFSASPLAKCTSWICSAQLYIYTCTLLLGSFPPLCYFVTAVSRHVRDALISLNLCELLMAVFQRGAGGMIPLADSILVSLPFQELPSFMVSPTLGICNTRAHLGTICPAIFQQDECLDTQDCSSSSRIWIANFFCCVCFYFF